MSFTINNKLSFVDSFEFLSYSLAGLVKNLNKYDFKYLHLEFDNNVLDLVKWKGFYLNEYMSDSEKFKKELPCKEKFDTFLAGRKFTDKEYESILNVWNKLEMKTMKNYHNLYLNCDILSLADVFEKFRNDSIRNYGLCPSHYLSTPGLSWDAMLKITKIKLELIPDPDMYIFFGRGTISYISNRNRYSKANNK